jgi:hypothetical protein
MNSHGVLAVWHAPNTDTIIGKRATQEMFTDGTPHLSAYGHSMVADGLHEFLFRTGYLP